MHELIGINLNRVDLKSVPDLKLEEKEVVVSQEVCCVLLRFVRRG